MDLRTVFRRSAESVFSIPEHARQGSQPHLFHPVPKEDFGLHIGRGCFSWLDPEFIGTGASRTVEKSKDRDRRIPHSRTEDPNFLKCREFFWAGSCIDGKPTGREAIILSFAFHPKITGSLKNGDFVRPVPVNGAVNPNTTESQIGREGRQGKRFGRVFLDKEKLRGIGD
jgi:hypothetical protein